MPQVQAKRLLMVIIGPDSSTRLRQRLRCKRSYDPSILRPYRRPHPRTIERAIPAPLISVLFEVTERRLLRPSGFSMYQLHSSRRMPAHCGCTNSRLICTGFHQRGCKLDELAMPPSATPEMAKYSACA